MNVLQKWLVVIAILVFATGTFLNGINGRYRMGKVSMDSAQRGKYLSVRFDTWTGEVEVKDSISQRWVKGSSVFVDELK
ncbi:MAG: hypothetical protein Q8O30_12440 [Candidatus Omnitrophota bacterium]|nr:hypothetical protein [Candidatus Omnitrophota bacterium]